MNEVIEKIAKYRLAVQETESAREDYRTASRRLGESIRSYMQKSGFPYQQLADKIGVSKLELFFVCRNHRCPREKTVAKIEKYFSEVE
jgi:ribosome-binding protein aMBF1 (putative translation factor)